MGVRYGPAQPAKPSVFVGSSSESAEYAGATKKILEENGTLSAIFWKDLPWATGTKTIIEILTKAAVKQFHFAVFILAEDDVLTLRGTSSHVPRDNVIFEVGLFIGALGRECVFLMTPGDGDLKLPSDMGGVTTGTWIAGDSNTASAVRSAVEEFRAAMEEMWRNEAMLNSSVGGRLAGSRTADSDDGDVWIKAHKAGVLEPLDSTQVRIDDLIVHPNWGPGVVTEVGPSRGGARHLTVEFPHGTAMILSDDLMMQRFARPIK